MTNQGRTNFTLFYLKQYKRNCLLHCLVLTLFFSSQVNAQGDLLVTPRRVVLDGTKKSVEFNLANVGKDSATYIVSFIQIRMSEDGTFEQIAQPDSGQQFADRFLRIFPRTITLAPNEAQSVKLQLVRTNELASGEYRSHLYFRVQPNNKPLGEEDVKKDSGISVQLIPVFGISLPVIIRKGASTAQISLSQLSFNLHNDTIPSLKLTFNRTGNMSIYGDLSVNHIAPDGKKTQVGMVKGISVYTPNNTRNFNLLLDITKKVNYHLGKLQITYSDSSPQPVVYTENEITLL